MHLFYASHDGHTRRIAEHIAARLEGLKVVVRPHNLAESIPAAASLSGTVVLVAAIRYGRHLPAALRFLESYSRLANRPALVLLSVNLTARKPNKQSPEGSVYLRKTIRKYHLEPALAHAIAGRLDYPRYSWFDRQMIRFIMLLTGGPTDPSTTIEYTDWDQVDALAERIARIDGASS